MKTTVINPDIELVPEDVQYKTDIQQFDPGKVAANGYKWLSNYPILTDWHINSIILDCMVMCDRLRNVELTIDNNNQVIGVTAVVSMWTLLFKSTLSEIHGIISKIISIYAPEYKMVLRYKYGRKSPRSAVDGKPS